MTDNNQKIAPHPRLTDYYSDSETDRRKEVDDMFNKAAIDYDWINSVMSFGSGERYRKETLKRIGLKNGEKLLDVGSGTGVIAKIAQDMVGDDGYVVALDPSEGMLGEAKKRGVKNTVIGLGEDLPFEDNTFDYLTMGYALRHVNDLRQTFAEYRRVLKPGGKVLLLEITRPDPGLKYHLVKFYMKHVIPWITLLFRRSKPAQRLMQYYWDTIEQCVPPKTILEALQEVGFKDSVRRIELGIFSEYSGEK